MKFNCDDVKRIMNNAQPGFIDEAIDLTVDDISQFNALAAAILAEGIRINSLDDELAEGKHVATRLAEHLDRMRAVDCSFIVDVCGTKYSVKVERVCDEHIH